MAKLSALVIPAVIDTSGVDRGINQIKSKMSRVRGSGGVGGGISAGHSAGIVPFGVGDGFGGAAGAAMGAAFGAAAASRTQEIASGARIGRSANIAKLSYAEQRAYRTQSIIGGMFQRVSDYATQRQTYFASRNAALKEAERGMPWRDKWMRKSNPERLMNQQGYDFWNRIRDKANVYGTTATTISNRIAGPRMLGDMPQSGGVIGAALGIATGYAALKHIDPIERQRRNASPISQFAGTQNYTALAAMKTKAEASRGQYMGFGQAFDVGAERAAGGGATLADTVGNFYGNARQTLGEFLGASTTNPAYGAAMMMAPGAGPAVHGALADQTNFVLGSMVNEIGNQFKRLFN
jgi:hypothetical protein